MAVVIKEGDPSKIPGFTFECTVCGCIFIASKEECLRLRASDNKTKLFHACPTCGCEVKCEIDNGGE